MFLGSFARRAPVCRSWLLRQPRLVIYGEISQHNSRRGCSVTTNYVLLIKKEEETDEDDYNLKSDAIHFVSVFLISKSQDCRSLIEAYL